LIFAFGVKSQFLRWGRGSESAKSRSDPQRKNQDLTPGFQSVQDLTAT
jgi:hypothetical protein